MSGYDNNPFAAGDSNNPFGDPAVSQVTTEAKRVQPSLEEYNPFDNQGSKKKETNNSSWQENYNQPAVMPSLPTSGYASSGARSVNSEDLMKRQEDLERRAAEIEAKEHALQSGSNVQIKNWPPIPKRCCGGPCFYHDISFEIPPEFQKTVKIMYFLWLSYVVLLFINFIGALSMFAVGGEAINFAVSFIVLILFPPLSLLCWYRPIYKAFRNDSSVSFMAFFFNFFIQCIVSFIYAAGIARTGSCGIFSGMDLLNGSKSSYAVGVMVISIGMMWLVFGLAGVVMLIKIHRIYRSTGASFQKAQKEFASGVAQNESVQNAASSVVAGAVQQNINRY